MEWFKNTFLKSIIENPKTKDISGKNEVRKTIIISEKQLAICEKYMNKVNNVSYTGYNGYHLEFNAFGYDMRADIQPKGYAILVIYKFI